MNNKLRIKFLKQKLEILRDYAERHSWEDKIKENGITQTVDDWFNQYRDELRDLYNEESKMNLDEGLFRESKNPLKDAAKKHRRKQKGLSPFSYLNPNAGDVEKNIAFFNHAMGSDGVEGIGESISESVDYILSESDIDIINDAIYWAKRSLREGENLTISQVLNQLNTDMKGFIDNNKSAIIDYLKDEGIMDDSYKNMKESIEDRSNVYMFKSKLSIQTDTDLLTGEISGVYDLYYNVKIDDYNIIEDIKQFIENFYPEDLYKYMDEELKEKVNNINIEVKEENEDLVLYTFVEFKNDVNISLGLLKEIQRYLAGQFSDGWGESLEQQVCANFNFEDEDGFSRTAHIYVTINDTILAGKAF